MNICMRCGKSFEEPGKETDDVGYTYSICPYCESDNFSTAEKCPFTDEYIPFGQGVSASVQKRVRASLEKIVEDECVINADQLYSLLVVIGNWLEERA